MPKAEVSGKVDVRTCKGLTSSFSLGRPFSKLAVFNCIHKKNWLCNFHTHTKNSHSIQLAILHSQSFRGYHNASLLPSPQFSLSDVPFLGTQGGDQSPLLTVGVGPDWGPTPGGAHARAPAGRCASPSHVCLPRDGVLCHAVFFLL